MSDDTECFGMDIKRCAKIVAIIGIILSVCSFNLIGFVIYVLVYLGVDNNKPGYLLPAKICLLIVLALTILGLFLVGILFVLGTIALQDSRVQSYTNEYKPVVNDLMQNDLVRTQMQFNAFKFGISIFTACITFGYMIISYIVVSKARRFMLSDSSTQIHANPGEYKQVYVQP
uniref:Uncharacterized protein n=1 Tax=Panagrolaimus superbus TaxID=310955 RepID=A0A914Z6N4_9BILA